MRQATRDALNIKCYSRFRDDVFGILRREPGNFVTLARAFATQQMKAKSPYSLSLSLEMGNRQNPVFHGCDGLHARDHRSHEAFFQTKFARDTFCRTAAFTFTPFTEPGLKLYFVAIPICHRATNTFKMRVCNWSRGSGATERALQLLPRLKATNRIGEPGRPHVLRAESLWIRGV